MDFPFDDVSTFTEKPEAKKEVEEEDTELDSEPPEVDLSKENNLKNLRQLAGNFKKERDQFRKKVEELEKRTSLSQDEPTRKENLQLKDRVKKLEQLELVYSLETSPLFVQNYTQPLRS